MTTPVDELPEDAPCLCGCIRALHRLGRKGCKTVDCGCDRFELDESGANNDPEPAEPQRAPDLEFVMPEAQHALPVEIHGWDAWQCMTCGSRYRTDLDHECGPLKPVRVSITER